MGTITPLFPFGHGLSYTNFEYGTLDVEVTGKCADKSGAQVVVRIGIRNAGSRIGAEVVQVYSEMAPSQGGIMPGPRSLCAFTRTAELAPGEEKRVSFTLGTRALGAAFNVEAGAWTNP